MRGSSFVVAALLAACAAGTAQGQTEYITECVARAVEQAQTAGDYSGYGMASDSFCLLGGWITEGHQLQYSMTMKSGHSYLFVGGGDRDVADLDLSVSDGSNDPIADQETDNTPFVHVVAESDVEVTITLTNYDGSGQPDFCSMIILEDQGGQANLSSLSQAASGLCELINRVSGYSTDKASDGSSWCLLGGLFGSGGQLGISRSFNPGTYALVGWGDSRAKDVDASVQDATGETVAEDSATDNTPVVEFQVSGDEALRGTLNLKMHDAQGNAFAVCCVLKQD